MEECLAEEQLPFKDGIASVFMFYPLLQSELDGLRTYHREYAEYLPSGILPIGRDHAGNQVCLAVCAERYEGVTVAELTQQKMSFTQIRDRPSGRHLCRIHKITVLQEKGDGSHCKDRRGRR